MKQPSTVFTHLQYRKERGAPFWHEFIVAELDNNTVCRFDRAGESDARGDAITGENMKSQDTTWVLSMADFVELDKTSKVLLRVHFPQGQDLISVLATCYGVKTDNQAQFYTVTRYNCYFLSWTILITAARRTVDWSIIGRDEQLWDGLVKSGIRKLTSCPEKNKTRTRFALGQILNANEPEDNSLPFVGAAHLVETLRQALVTARSAISRTLSELALHSSVEKAVRVLSEDFVRSAATEAAKKHAYHTARDAAMEAVVELMWEQVLTDCNAGKVWEGESRKTEGRVRDAAEAAANVDLGAGLEGEEWELAWDASWRKQDLSAVILSRAKSGWRDAWTKACAANEVYLPKISSGVAEYVMDHLPDSTPDILTIEKVSLALVTSWF
jgi:hypothetical protein